MKRAALDARLVGDLSAAASRDLLVALDLDGTLAPIARHRASVRLPATTRDLLARVAQRYPTAVITGRSRADARARLGGVRLTAIVGNHGLEAAVRHRVARAMVRRWMTRLEATPGLDIENKGESLSIHFRNAANPGLVKRSALAALARLQPRPRVIEGKALLNVLPDIGIDKGTALRTLMQSLGVHDAVYVGDDLTDEDVFSLPHSAGVITVRVGPSYASRARYSIPAQRYIDRLLAVLVEARASR